MKSVSRLRRDDTAGHHNASIVRVKRPGPLLAWPAGAPRAELVRLLGDRYAENSVGLGIARNGGVIELFTAKDCATWSSC